MKWKLVVNGLFGGSLRTDKTKVLLLGLSVRLALTPLTGHPWDMEVWRDVGYRVWVTQENVYRVGVEGSWAWGYYAYPPGWLLWCAAAYPASANPRLFSLAIKLPLILADFLTALLIYRCVLEESGSEGAALEGLTLYFLNPVVVVVGAVWGMFDALPASLTFLAILLLSKGRLKASAAALGLAIAFKIYPVLLLPFILSLIKVKLRGRAWDLLAYSLPSLGIPAAASAPFLILDSQSYVQSLLSHRFPTGWLTYWLLLSHVSSLFGRGAFYAFLAILAPLYLLVVRKFRPRAGSAFRSAAAGSLSLIAILYFAYPKVNAQYLVWALPLAAAVCPLAGKGAKRSVLALTAFDGLLVLSLAPLNGFFLLDRSVDPPGWASALLPLAAAASVGFPLASYGLFKRLTLKAGAPKSGVGGKLALAVPLALLALLVSPIPCGVSAGKAEVKVAIPESPATGFSAGAKDRGVEGFLRKFSGVDVVVLPLGPDFVNTYRGYDGNEDVTRFFRAWYYERWRQEDLRALVGSLHERGAKAVLGCYLTVDYLVGGRGYVSRWVKVRHPEVVKENAILLSARLRGDWEYGVREGMAYHEYFLGKALRILEDFGFDGILLFNPEFSSLDEEGLLEAYDNLSVGLRGRGLLFMASDPCQKEHLGFYAKLIPKLDFLIVQTLPWAKGAFKADWGKGLNYFESYSRELLALAGEEADGKALFALEFMDEQEGWFNPRVYLNEELRRFGGLGFSGFAVAFANKLSPYWLS